MPSVFMVVLSGSRTTLGDMSAAVADRARDGGATWCVPTYGAAGLIGGHVQINE
jgi:hypothetical protein